MKRHEALGLEIIRAAAISKAATYCFIIHGDARAREAFILNLMQRHKRARAFATIRVKFRPMRAHARDKCGSNYRYIEYFSIAKQNYDKHYVYTYIHIYTHDVIAIVAQILSLFLSRVLRHHRVETREWLVLFFTSCHIFAHCSCIK